MILSENPQINLQTQHTHAHTNTHRFHPCQVMHSNPDPHALFEEMKEIFRF